MVPVNNSPHRTVRERIFHALAFEGIAIVLAAPLLAWLLGKPLGHMGLLTLMFSTIAMLWNIVFNALFDRLQHRHGFARTWSVRVGHALLFEVGLVVMLVPMAAYYLSISLAQAFLLDIGLLLMFLPYTLGFNWAYDRLRVIWTSNGGAASVAGTDTAAMPHRNVTT